MMLHLKMSAIILFAIALLQLINNSHSSLTTAQSSLVGDESIERFLKHKNKKTARPTTTSRPTNLPFRNSSTNPPSRKTASDSSTTSFLRTDHGITQEASVNPEPIPGTTLTAQQQPSLTASVPIKPFCSVIEENVDYLGKDICYNALTNSDDCPSSPTAEGCCSKCAQRPGCGAYTWTSHRGGTCWLKEDSTGGSMEKKGCRSAVLVRKPEFLLDHGTIQSALIRGKCIDAGDKRLSRQLTLNDCQGYTSDSQQIFVRPNTRSDELRLQLVGTNFCLDALGFAPGSAVSLANCSSYDNQKWTYTPDKELRTVSNTTLCLEIKEASKINGALLQVGICSGEDHQKWEVGDSQPSQVIQIDIKSSSSVAVCFRVDARDLNTMPYVGILDCNAGIQQQQFKYDGGTFRLSLYNDLCLDAFAYPTLPEGGLVTLRPCNGRDNQVWDYDPSPSGQMFRARYNSSLCLSYEGQAMIKEDGWTRLWVYPCDDTKESQKWRWHLPEPVAFLTDHGTIKSVSAKDKCIDPGDNSSSQQLTLYDCEGYKSQGIQLFVRPNSRADELRIQLVGTFFCIEVIDRAVVLNNCNSTDYQRWIYTSINELRPIYNTTLCLEIKDKVGYNGALLQVGPCNGEEHQKWEVGESNPSQVVQIDLFTDYVNCARVDAYHLSQGSWVYMNHNCFTGVNQHQQFTYIGGTFRLASNSSLCLDALAYPSSKDSGQVSLWSCNGQTNQIWDYDPSRQMFRARYNSNFCLSYEGQDIIDNGWKTRLWVYDCNETKTSQKWNWHLPEPNIFLTDHGTIENMLAKDKCIDAVDINPSQQLLLRNCEGYTLNRKQIFARPNTLNDELRIQLVGTNFCLDASVFDGPGSEVVLGYCSTASSQQWIYNSNKELRVVYNNTTLCLEFKDAGEQNGTLLALQVGACNGGKHQKWKMGRSRSKQVVQVDPKSDGCIRADGYQLVKDTNIYVGPCTNEARLSFNYFGGAFRSATNNTLCLDANLPSSYPVGKMVTLLDCNGQPNQIWDYDPLPERKMFRSRYDSSLCLSFEGQNVSQVFLKRLWTYPCNETDESQKWSWHLPSDIAETVKLIRSDIENLIANNRTLIPKLVRLGFHDCVGRCDGCVDLDDDFNEGLNIPIDALYNITQKYTVEHYSGISRADIWALAAVTAANRSQSALDFPFSWFGRVDCEVDSKKGPHREMPSPDFNTKQVLAYFQEYFGFNESQTVAIMGAHNLGAAHPDISGFNGSWVHKNDNLSSSYYHNLVDPNWNQTLLSSTKKWQWELNGLMMLNSDVALVREFEVDNEGDAPGEARCLFIHRDEFSKPNCPFAYKTKTFVDQYKDNENLWLQDFRDVFTAMLVNGYDTSVRCGEAICQLGLIPATVCRDTSFVGPCGNLRTGNYDVSDLKEAGMYDDWISSIKVSDDYSVTAYSDPDFKGQSVTFNTDTASVGYDWNDKISSITVSKGIIVCEKADFQGICVTLVTGSYDAQDLSSKGITDGWISSIKIPNGYSVTAYSASSYSGQSFTFFNDASNVTKDWGGNISSIKVNNGFLVDCTVRPTYTPPLDCSKNCLNLTSVNDTKKYLIERINTELNEANATSPNITLSLCPGIYSWPTDAGVWINRTVDQSSVNLTLNCCGYAGKCIFDGYGQTYHQPLFKFDSPVNLTVTALTFRDFRYDGNPNKNGAIIRTTAFSDTNLHFLNVSHVMSQGQGGVFAFESQTIVNITSSTFSHNSAELDGGVIYYFSSSHLMLRSNNFTENEATGKGGALHSVFSYTRAECNRFTGNKAGSGGAIFLDSSTVDFNGDNFTSNNAGSGTDAYLKSSGVCKQSSSTTLSTILNKVFVDSNSIFIPRCDDLDWKIASSVRDAAEKPAVPYRPDQCSLKPEYQLPTACKQNNLCQNLSKLEINRINEELSNSSNAVMNLCPGTYVWPNDLNVLINHSKTNAKLIGTLIINCCGNASACIVDGDGRSFSQSLFQFDSPIIFIMKGVKFQNFNYVGSDAAIVTTRAFTVMDFQYLNVTNVVSQGKWGVFGFEAPAIVDITSSVFTNNSAGVEGGVISTSGISLISLLGSNFTNNTARDRGGVLHSLQSYIRAACNRFENNTVQSADGEGGGFYLNKSSMQCSEDYFHETDVYVESSGFCKQSSNATTNFDDSSRITVDSKSFLVDLCDGDHWGRTSTKRKTF